MKITFRQYLIESYIQVPASTLDEVMQIVCSSYFSDLLRRIRIDGEQPDPYIDTAIEQYKNKYGDFNIVEVNGPFEGLMGKATFYTNELPARYRKKSIKNYTVRVWAGPMKPSTGGGEYAHNSKGKSSLIQINTQAAGNIDSAVYNPKIIDKHLEFLQVTATHELQHMVQDIALKRLHPSQHGTDEDRLAGMKDENVYYNSTEEFLPQITSAVGIFKNSIRGIKDKNIIQSKFYDAVDPSRGGEVYPFFNAIYSDKQKWKKAVKEFHRLLMA